MTRPMHVDEIQEPFDLGSGPYFVVQEEDDVPERAVFYDEADARLFIEAVSATAEQSVPLDVTTLQEAMERSSGLLNMHFGPGRVPGWGVVAKYVAAEYAHLLLSEPSEPARPADAALREAAGVLVHHMGCSLPTEGEDACPICTPLYDADTDGIGSMGVAIEAVRAALAASQPTAGEEPDAS